MAALIVGSGGLFDAICLNVPPERWRVPAGSDWTQQVDFLAKHPAKHPGKDVVFTNVPGNWLSVRRAGWTVLWCSTDRMPAGVDALPERSLDTSVTSMTRRFWGMDIADSRLVGEILLGNTRQQGRVIIVTSCSGGVGKTVSSRRLCERFATMRTKEGRPLNALLVDGNMLQSSQRSFFDPMRRMNVKTIADWLEGGDIRYGANPRRMFDVGYDIAFAPPTGSVVSWEHYAAFLREAQRKWDVIVMDIDRISAADLEDDSTVAGHILVPFVQSGSHVLFIVKAGQQTQGDALSVLSNLPAASVPRELVGIKETIPPNLKEYPRLSYDRFGIYLGAEQQSERASELIAAGKGGWDDPGLDMIRDRTILWACPDLNTEANHLTSNPPKRGEKGGRRGGRKGRQAR